MSCPSGKREGLLGLSAQAGTRLEQLIRAVAADQDWTVIELAIQPEHVHLFLRANPYPLPADIARLLTGRRSHDLRAELPHWLKLPAWWTRSCFLSTAGHVSQQTLRHYSERQSRV